MAKLTLNLPQELVEALRRQATAAQKTTDELVAEWIVSRTAAGSENEKRAAFAREVTAFERLRSSLLSKYAGQFVAIYQEQVVASGTDKLAVAAEVRERYGPVVFYVEQVTRAAPRTARMLLSPAEADPRVAREKAAYVRLHPRLRETHAGQYVAIYDGRLVDHDEDYGALFERVDAAYPDDFVWLTRVQDEPVGTLHFRSPRLLDDNP